MQSFVVDYYSKIELRNENCLFKGKYFPVATASKDEISNVVPIGFCQLVANESIWFEDNFMVKSLKNLGKN